MPLKNVSMGTDAAAWAAASPRFAASAALAAELVVGLPCFDNVGSRRGRWCPSSSLDSTSWASEM
jgi:hypothetical protein